MKGEGSWSYMCMKLIGVHKTIHLVNPNLMLCNYYVCITVHAHTVYCVIFISAWSVMGTVVAVIVVLGGDVITFLLIVIYILWKR